MTFGMGVSLLLSLVAADALSPVCHSLPGVFIEPDSSGAVEMDGFLLTEPVCALLQSQPRHWHCRV